MSTQEKFRRNFTTLMAGVAVAAFTFVAVPDYAFAQKSSHSDSGSHSSDASHTGKKGGVGKGKSGSGVRGNVGKGSKSLRDIFHEMESGTSSSSATSATHDDSSHASKGKKQSGKKSGSTTAKGKKPSSSSTDTKVKSAEEEDSDRPEWAGTPGKDGKPGRPNQTSGTKKGGLYGDMYALLRDENGVPIYIQLPDGTWVVQPIDADGNAIPLDEEGHPINPDLTIEVELGRLNVGRAPTSVLVQRYDEVLKILNVATAVTIDAAGRLVLTVDGEEKTIDSPLENLAIYVELMNTGTLTDVTNTSIFTGDLANLVDGSLTIDDLVEAKSFLAASSDKFGSISLDTVEYLNLMVELDGTLTDQSNLKYVDFTSFTYDREATYKDVTADVLILKDGAWIPTTVNIYETVFASTDYDATNAVAFTQAADDARAVIEFVHEYEIPTTPATQ